MKALIRDFPRQEETGSPCHLCLSFQDIHTDGRERKTDARE